MNPSDNREKYAIEIKDPSRHMTFTYVISLAIIALLAVLSQLFLDKVIDQQSQVSHIINTSGQQRMLSQRASLFTLEYLSSRSTDSKAIAEKSISTMLENHRFLLSEHYENTKSGKKTTLSPELYALYFEAPHNVDAQIKSFAKSIEYTLAPSPTTKQQNTNNLNPNFIPHSQESLLECFHKILTQYQLESDKKIHQFRTIKNIVLAVLLLTIFVEAFFIFRPMVANISNFARRIQHEANYDMLTGLFNRRAFDLLALQKFSEAQRYKSTLSVMMCDIDYFKKVNDTLGHTAGDLAIQKVAHALQACIRSSDILARFGGEEFIFILPQTPFSNAVTLGEKLRQVVENLVLEYKEKSFSVTASFGISEIKPEDDNLDAIVARADIALYRAKDAGRNRVDDQQT